MESLRKLRCAEPLCGAIFLLCSRCFCGQCYCAEDCRTRARRAQCQAAQRAYRDTENGRKHCAQASAAYRKHRRDKAGLPASATLINGGLGGDGELLLASRPPEVCSGRDDDGIAEQGEEHDSGGCPIFQSRPAVGHPAYDLSVATDEAFGATDGSARPVGGSVNEVAAKAAVGIPVAADAKVRARAPEASIGPDQDLDRASDEGLSESDGAAELTPADEDDGLRHAGQAAGASNALVAALPSIAGDEARGDRRGANGFTDSPVASHVDGEASAVEPIREARRDLQLGLRTAVIDQPLPRALLAGYPSEGTLFCARCRRPGRLRGSSWW